MQYGIITADIQGSTELNREAFQRILKDLEKLLTAIKEAGSISYYAFFQGDSLQVIIPQPAYMLDYAMILKTAVIQAGFEGPQKAGRRRAITADLRLSMAMGALATPQNPAKSNDPPLIRSGRGLERLKKQKKLLGFFDDHSPIEQEVNTQLGLWEHIMRNWSVFHAQIFHRKLQKVAEKQIASEFDVSQPAINQSSSRAGWPAYSQLSRRFHHLLKNHHE
jgi:predicted AlkP superfamily pyrophosphatase or phosphodiesterase